MAEAGERYTYTGETLGTAGDLPTGTEIEVRELVPADVPGAHDDAEDAVVIEWTDKTVGIGENGEQVLVDRRRAMSVSEEFFSDNFEAVGS